MIRKRSLKFSKVEGTFTFTFREIYHFKKNPQLFLFSHCPILHDLWTIASHAPLSSTVSRSLPKITFVASVTLPNHLIFSHPLSPLPSIFPSIRVFQWIFSSHLMVKVFELQIQFLSFQRTVRLISFKVDCFVSFVLLSLPLSYEDDSRWHTAIIICVCACACVLH